MHKALAKCERYVLAQEEAHRHYLKKASIYVYHALLASKHFPQIMQNCRLSAKCADGWHTSQPSLPYRRHTLSYHLA